MPGAGQAATVGLAGEAGHHALLALPHRQRAALVLHTYMGLSTEQAAQAMGISTGAARSHLAAAMSSLRHLPGPK